MRKNSGNARKEHPAYSGGGLVETALSTGEGLEHPLQKGKQDEENTPIGVFPRPASGQMAELPAPHQTQTPVAVPDARTAGQIARVHRLADLDTETALALADVFLQTGRRMRWSFLGAAVVGVGGALLVPHFVPEIVYSWDLVLIPFLLSLLGYFASGYVETRKRCREHGVSPKLCGRLYRRLLVARYAMQMEGKSIRDESTELAHRLLAEGER